MNEGAAHPRNGFYRGMPIVMSVGPADLAGGFSAGPCPRPWPAAQPSAYEDSRDLDGGSNGPKLPFFDFLGVGAM